MDLARNDTHGSGRFRTKMAAKVEGGESGRGAARSISRTTLLIEVLYPREGSNAPSGLLGIKQGANPVRNWRH